MTSFFLNNQIQLKNLNFQFVCKNIFRYLKSIILFCVACITMLHTHHVFMQQKKKTSQNIKNQVNSNKNNLKFANVFKNVKAKKET